MQRGDSTSFLFPTTPSFGPSPGKDSSDVQLWLADCVVPSVRVCNMRDSSLLLLGVLPSVPLD